MRASSTRFVIVTLLLFCGAAIAGGSPVSGEASSREGACRLEVRDGRSAVISGVEHLYAVDIVTDELLLVDKHSAYTKELGAMSEGIITGLAYDHQSELIYAVDGGSRRLLTINASAGWTTTVVGNMQVMEPHAVAIDPSDGLLYVVGMDPNAPPASTLYVVDKVSAVATAVGFTGFDSIAGLDFDPSTGTLFGSRAGPYDTGLLLTIDTSTGEASEVVCTVRFTTISFDENGVLYGVDNGSLPGQMSRLYTLDTSTGAATLVGSLGVDNVLGAVFDSSIPSAVQCSSWGRIKALCGGAE